MEVQQDQLTYQSVSSTLSITETVGLLRPSGESVKSTYLAGHEYHKPDCRSRRQRNGEKYPECPVQSLQSEEVAVTTILLLWQLRLRHSDAIRNVSKTGHRLRRVADENVTYQTCH